MSTKMRALRDITASQSPTRSAIRRDQIYTLDSAEMVRSHQRRGMGVPVEADKPAAKSDK